MKRIVFGLFCLLAVALPGILPPTPAAAVVTTGPVSITNTAWTSLGAGPLLITSDAPIVYAISDTTPAIPLNQGYRVDKYVNFTVSTTSQVWVMAQNASGAKVYYAPVVAGGSSGGVASITTQCGTVVTGGPSSSAVVVHSDIPPVSEAASYPIVGTDCGTLFYVPAGTAAGVVFTMPSPATVGLGWSINGIINFSSNPVSVASPSGTFNGVASPITIAAGGSVQGQASTGADWISIPTRSLAGSTGDIQTNAGGGAFGSLTPNVAGGVPKINTTLTAGNYTKWSASGLVDGGSGTSGSALQINVGYANNLWYRSPVELGPSTGLAQTTNRLVCTPITIGGPVGIKVKALGLDLTTQDITANASEAAAIYTFGADGFPGALLDSIAPILTVGTTPVLLSGAPLAGPLVLAPGTYARCTATNTGIAVFASVSNNALGLTGSQFGYPTAVGATGVFAASNFNYIYCQLTVGACGPAWVGATFAWPSSLTGAAWTALNATQAPLIALQAQVP